VGSEVENLAAAGFEGDGLRRLAVGERDGVKPIPQIGDGSGTAIAA